MLFFQMQYFYVVIFMLLFLNNSLLYVIRIKDSFLLSLPKEFLYQLVRLVANW